VADHREDNYDTVDMPTSAGSLSLKGSIPPRDAFQVRKLREAGAIMLVKTNMAGVRFDPFRDRSLSAARVHEEPLRARTRHRGLERRDRGGVAANFGAVGLGTDTGNSIRGPASHTSLVGIARPMGLTSRDGSSRSSSTRTSAPHGANSD